MTLHLAPAKIDVRYAVRADLPLMAAIERGGSADPWGPKRITDELSRRDVVALVADRGGFPVGHLIYALTDFKFHILRLLVDPRHRDKGVGTAMVDALAGKLSEGRRDKIVCDVPERLLAVQQFLRAQGFLGTKVLRGGGGEDDEFRMVLRLHRAVRLVA